MDCLLGSCWSISCVLQILWQHHWDTGDVGQWWQDWSGAGAGTDPSYCAQWGGEFSLGYLVSGQTELWYLKSLKLVLCFFFKLMKQSKMVSDPTRINASWLCAFAKQSSCTVHPLKTFVWNSVIINVWILQLWPKKCFMRPQWPRSLTFYQKI